MNHLIDEVVKNISESLDSIPVNVGIEKEVIETVRNID